MYDVIGRAGHRSLKDIAGRCRLGTVSCTAIVLKHGTGGPPEPQGHQLAVVANRDGQLYCMFLWRKRRRKEEKEEEEEEEAGQRKIIQPPH